LLSYTSETDTYSTIMELYGTAFLLERRFEDLIDLVARVFPSGLAYHVSLRRDVRRGQYFRPVSVRLLTPDSPFNAAVTVILGRA